MKTIKKELQLTVTILKMRKIILQNNNNHKKCKNMLNLYNISKILLKNKKSLNKINLIKCLETKMKAMQNKHLKMKMYMNKMMNNRLIKKIWNEPMNKLKYYIFQYFSPYLFTPDRKSVV